MHIPSTRNREIPRSPERIELLRSEIDCFLKIRFGYNADLVRIAQFGMALDAERTKISLFARTRHSGRFRPDETFVICRLGFPERERGRGHGRSLIEFLARILPGHGYSRIVLDQCNTDAAGFAAKLGFERCLDNPQSFFRTLDSRRNS